MKHKKRGTKTGRGTELLQSWLTLYGGWERNLTDGEKGTKQSRESQGPYVKKQENYGEGQSGGDLQRRGTEGPVSTGRGTSLKKK